MSDNTKTIGLSWPDDRQGSLCSLTPLMRPCSADSSVSDLYSHREVISDVEVHLENTSTIFPAPTSAAASSASAASVAAAPAAVAGDGAAPQNKPSGMYKKNPIKSVASDAASGGKQQQQPVAKTTYDVFAASQFETRLARALGSKSANGCGTPPEYDPDLRLVRTWSNPTLSDGRAVMGCWGTGLDAAAAAAAVRHKQLQGPCSDRANKNHRKLTAHNSMPAFPDCVGGGAGAVSVLPGVGVAGCGGVGCCAGGYTNLAFRPDALPPPAPPSQQPAGNKWQFQRSLSEDERRSLSQYSYALSTEDRMCRICWAGEELEPVLQPCYCAAFVHVTCLQKWLQVAKAHNCEVCNFQFKAEKRMKPIKEWVWRPKKNRHCAQVEATVILLCVVTPPLLCGVVLCSQKISDLIRIPEASWKTAALMTLVLISLFTYLGAVVYFCKKLSKVCRLWIRLNRTTVITLMPRTEMIKMKVDLHTDDAPQPETLLPQQQQQQPGNNNPGDIFSIS